MFHGELWPNELIIKQGQCSWGNSRINGKGILLLTSHENDVENGFLIGSLVFLLKKGVLGNSYSTYTRITLHTIMSLDKHKDLFNKSIQLNYSLDRGQTSQDLSIRGLEDIDNWFEEINGRRVIAGKIQHFFWGLNNVLNSQESTDFENVYQLYEESIGKYPKCEEKWIIKFIQAKINNKEIDGFLNIKERMFNHMTAFKQKTESVNYNISTKFEFDKNGVLLISCPHCNGSNSIIQKTNIIKCKYCDQDYIVPKKVLELL